MELDKLHDLGATAIAGLPRGTRAKLLKSAIGRLTQTIKRHPTEARALRTSLTARTQLAYRIKTLELTPADKELLRVTMLMGKLVQRPPHATDNSWYLTPECRQVARRLQKELETAAHLIDTQDVPDDWADVWAESTAEADN